VPRHFKHWLKAYLDYTSASEAPDAFHFWTGVSTIAGALRRHVWVEQHIFQWIPNFYIIFVAPAGVATKSTTLNLGMGLLEQVDGVHFGPESGSWQGLGDALEASITHFPYPGTAILDSSNDQVMSAITVAASELGTFLRPDDEHAMSFLTDTWDGRKREFLHRTKHSGSIKIPRPVLNLIGATTPSWLQRNLGENLIGDGLMSRVVFVYAEQKRRYVALPSRHIQTKDFLSNGKKLVEDLKIISEIIGPYEFEPEVEKDGGWMDLWYANHHSNRALHMASDRYGGYISRKQTHMVKLALVLAVSKRDARTITQEDLVESDAILTSAEHSMIRVFDSIGVVDEARQVAELMQFIKAYKWVSAKELRRLTHNTLADRDFKNAVRQAVEGGAVKLEARNGIQGLALNQTIH
jgi:hypothetical protein